MKIINSILVSFLILLSCVNAPAEVSKETLDKQYPNRQYYPQLSYITTKQMINAVNADKYNVIDARPVLAFDTLHVKEAANIEPGDKQFKEKLMNIIKKNDKPVVFYCGGLACLKSYKASAKAIKILNAQSIKRDVLTYDSGISAFAHASPEWVLKNGKEISADNPLLDLKKLKKHAKNSEEFVNMVNNDKNKQYVILDIRESSQKLLHKLFMFKNEKKITLLKPEKMIVFLNKIKGSGQTLMIYGSVEKQIETLYPLIKTSGNKKWFYLEGGEKAYSEYMIKKHVTS